MSRENSFEFLHLVHVVKEPNTFKHSDNVRDHLKNVSNYFDQTKCPDNLKLQMFLKYLSLGVLEDLKLQLEYHDKVDLDWYEDKMLELYDDRRSLVTILVELVEIKQKCSETTMDFASRIKEKVQNKKIPINMQENIKLQLFINGLCKKNYSKALQILNPKSLIEAVNMLRLDFNILEKNNDNEDSSESKVNNYLDIIKSLCDKITPSSRTPQNDNSFLTPDKYTIGNSNFQSIPEDYKLLFSEIIQKLKNPDTKGIMIFPKLNDRFKILDIPQKDIMVGIPYENESYDVISCKTDSGYVISDSLTKKPTVYKLPSDESLVLSASGKIRFINKPTLIGPSKYEKKMEIIPLPQSLDENGNPISCEDIISMFGSYNKKQILKKPSKPDVFDDTVRMQTQIINENNKSGCFGNEPWKPENNLNSINNSIQIVQNLKPELLESQNQIDKTLAMSTEIGNLAKLNFSKDFSILEDFQVLEPISSDNVTVHNPSIEYLSKFIETPLKETENNVEVNEINKAKISSISSSPNLIGRDDAHNLDHFNAMPVAQLVKAEHTIPHTTINGSKEMPTEKTIGRFKVISAPQN